MRLQELAGSREAALGTAQCSEVLCQQVGYFDSHDALYQGKKVRDLLSICMVVILLKTIKFINYYVPSTSLLVDVLDGDAFAAEFAWWEPLLDGVVATLDEDERRVLGGGEQLVVKDAAVACGCEAPGGSAAVAERRRAAARGRSLACCAAAP